MLTAATERARVADADAGRAATAGADAARRRAAANAVAAGRADVEAAQTALPGLAAVLAERTAERQRLEAEADLYQRQMLRGAYLRIDTLRAVLAAIGTGTRGRKASAEEALRLDDQHAELCAAAPASLAVLTDRVTAARTDEQAARGAVDAAERTIARLDLVRAAEQAMVDADAAQREAAEREARARADGAQARTDAQAHEAERARLAATLAALRAQDGADAVLRSRAADLDRLADEEAAIADVVARADREEAAALALLAALLPLDAPTQPVDPTALPRARAALQEAEQAHRRSVVDLATLEERVNVAHAARTKLALAEATLRPLVTRAQNIALLASALGPDGLQVDEIANAGPELSAVANDLLHRGYGARYTVMFDTSAKGDPGEDGDGCEIRVYDAMADAWATVEEMSGGQEVLIELAASLSIGALACHSAGIRRPTLARDEADAHLRPEHARAYARILMLGAELMEADVVLVVSHRDEVLAHADMVIYVADGTARLMSVDAWRALTAEP
jgi:DNA repair exonuclease SbcCD ATPase subunit